MSIVILFRKEFDYSNESKIASKYFEVQHYRTLIKDSLVIGRYACLPYYHELEKDLSFNNSRLINSYLEHKYIANFEYYNDIKEYTFKTWFRLQDVPEEVRNNKFVLKGKTNSKKQQWKTHMFANNFREAVNIYAELMGDPFIGPQDIIIREYEHLETFEVGINDMPMTNEWRLFYYKGVLLSWGYYWSIIDDLSVVEKAKVDFEKTGIEFANKVANIIKNKTNFFVIDVAKNAQCDWRVVEVNDGQQSGLNEFNDANTLYCNLLKAIG